LITDLFFWIESKLIELDLNVIILCQHTSYYKEHAKLFISEIFKK